jgi:DNA-directed RNA polymerase specialized sigma24 family protein
VQSADLTISRLIKTLGSVAMRCYSHLSDDEREQIGLAKALGHSIGAIAQPISRSKSTISRELSRNRLPSGRYSPPEPINCAGPGIVSQVVAYGHVLAQLQ